MEDFVRARSAPLSFIVLVLLIIVLLQSGISYTLSLGPLGNGVPSTGRGPVSDLWLAIRLVPIALTFVMWLLNRKRAMFRLIVVTNALLTVSLLLSVSALIARLPQLPPHTVGALMGDVLLVAASNILIFSVWYWIIDPPGVEDTVAEEADWAFLFPQRATPLPRFRKWRPRYTDYLYVAFTDSFAFGPTDTMPLTRRAKLLMLLQAAISIVTLTVIAASAVNILASGT